MLNNLYKHTQMQTTFGVIMLALVEGRPQVLTLKEMIQKFIEHRNEVVVRRSKFELDEAEKRAHILEGYIIALDNIDAIIKLIKASKDVETARTGLMKKFKLSEIQAKAILDMRLQRLTGLERKKIEDEYRETIKLIERLKAILKSKQLQMEIIKEELLEIRKKYGDERRTEIVYKAEEFSHRGHDRRGRRRHHDQPRRVHQAVPRQRLPAADPRRARDAPARRRRKTTSSSTCSSRRRTTTSCSSPTGAAATGSRCSRSRKAGGSARGKSIANLIAKEQDEIDRLVRVREELRATALRHDGDRTGNHQEDRPRGVRQPAAQRYRRQSAWTRATSVIDVRLTDGKQDIVIGTREGMAIRFHEQRSAPDGPGAPAACARSSSTRRTKWSGPWCCGAPVRRILVATENGLRQAERDR